MKRFLTLLAICAALLLAPACGGGDDGRTDRDVVDTQGPDGSTPDGVEPDGAGKTDVLPDGTPDTDVTTPDADVEPVDTSEASDDTDTTEPDTTEPEVVVCGTLPAVTDGNCAVTAGSGALRLQGTILAPAAVYEGGEVLVDDQGEIVCVGCDCGGEPEAQDATVVTCPGALVSPGIINAHEHLGFGQNPPGDWGTERFDHRHDWRKGKNGHDKISVPGNATVENKAWCELRHLLSGCTSIAGSDSSDGFLRNVDGSAQHGLNQTPVEYQTFPLGDSGGEQVGLDQACTAYPKVPATSVLDGTDCYFAHVAEGINDYARHEYLCLSSTENGGVDITTEKTAYVHMVGLTAMEGADVAASQTSIVWSPRSNVSLYGNTTPVTMYATQGVLLGLGTDWSASGSMNMQREMACALSMNDQHFGGFFSTRDLWRMATINNATILALDDRVGALEPGLVADIAIFAPHGEADPYRAILTAGAADTVLVLRGGEPLYGDAAIVAGLPASDGCPELTGGVCGVAKRICTQREIGQTFDALASANSGAYALFFCGVPAGEPTCVPSRPGEYTGEVTADDLDGDGIANAADDCPSVFNPVRPVDGSEQADADADGLGDLCDPCPLNAGTDQCTPPNPDDRDADGVPNATDNCPVMANGDQADNDADGKGNACDACPDEANPGSAACSASIYDVKTGVATVGSAVRVTGVVTAVAGPRWFMQVPEAEQDPALGATFSGLYVYVPAAGIAGITTPTRGDVVEVSGTISEFYGELELTTLTALTVLATGQDLPTPVVVETSAVGTAGVDHEAYEAVLVTVVDGVVTELNPAPGGGETAPTNEYVLDGALRVNDLMYATSPFPAVGDSLTITGILHWANDNSKLEPRDADDVVAALGLRSFGPSPVYVDLGAEEVPSVPPLTVTLNRPAPVGGVTVTFASDDEAVTIQPSLLIPEGSTSGSPWLGGVAVTTTPVEVTATALGKTLTAQVVVTDPAALPVPVAIDPDDATLMVGASLTMTVSLNKPAPVGGTLVTLAVDAAGVAFVQVPAEITVAAGSLTATFSASGLAAGTATLTAAAGGAEVTTTVTVAAVPQVGLVLSEVFYDPAGSDDNLEWVEIYNGTGAAIDLAGYSLAWAGTDYTWGKLQLVGTLEAGGCAVIGGPTSTAADFSPTFFQAVNLDQDIQNSGDAADAMALFAMPAASLNAASVPIDAVLYGGSNSSNLKDETGAAGAVDVVDVASGHSIERVGATWTDQATPTPNDCTKVLTLP